MESFSLFDQNKTVVKLGVKKKDNFYGICTYIVDLIYNTYSRNTLGGITELSRPGFSIKT